MNINRINFISQFVVPRIAEKPVILEKKQEYFKVTEVLKSDNDFKRGEQHDPMYYYEMMKNQNHINIKDISDECKNR